MEEDEGGYENCREEDEERKDAEIIEKSISRMVLKENVHSAELIPGENNVSVVIEASHLRHMPSDI